MAMPLDRVQSTLPLDLFDQLNWLRRRYATALSAAGRGDFSHPGDLRSVTRHLGKLLASEARKSPEERGGMKMLEISLAVDQSFPELRAWNQYDLAQSQRKRVQEANPPVTPEERAS